MIVVVGRVRTDEQRREQLIQIGQTVAAASRLETGCISYRLYEDAEIANDFLFIEEWESSEALQQHFGTDHVADFMKSIFDTLAAPPDVKFHTIERSMDLAEVSTR